jgi:diacylglycerol O-acyltransferase / wax synthase
MIRVEASTRSLSERRLSALDASYLYNESARNPLHVGAVLIFEGHIPFDKIAKSIAQRLHLVPRFQQRLAEVPFDLAFPSWENDRDFQLENHLKRFELPPGTNQQQAIRQALHAYHPMLDRRRPLWEFLCVEQWPGKHTALVCKFHHALADGASSVRLIKRLFDFSPEVLPPAALPRETPAAQLVSPSQMLSSAARDLVMRQVKSFADLMVEAFQHPGAFGERNLRLQQAIDKIAGPPGRRIVSTPWNKLGLSGVRDLVWFRKPFSDYRAIRKSFGCSTDDILLTALTEGAGRYLQYHGYSTDGHFRIACPVSVRRGEEQAEYDNRVSMVFPTIPARPMDAVERLGIVCRETSRIKPYDLQTMDRLGLRWTGALGSHLGAFPTGVFTSTLLNEVTPPSLAALTSRMDLVRTDAAAALIRAIGAPQCRGSLTVLPPTVSFVTSHVASAQSPVYLCGHRCVEQVGILPVCENLGYSVLVLSYNQTRCVGMSGDVEVIADLARMKNYVEASFNELKSAAAKQSVTANAETAEPPSSKPQTHLRPRSCRGIYEKELRQEPVTKVAASPIH